MSKEIKNTLIHTCCAPCSISCIQQLRAEEIAPTSFWFNPNIHPFTEYKSRRNTLREYAQTIALPLVEEDVYGLRTFTKAVIDDLAHRCSYCYETRLERTAQYAAEHGFDSFTTTLLVSPYQNHALLQEVGEFMAQKYGVPFLYRDFRPGFRQGQDEARALELYMQKYCGCIFSEEERYQKKPKKKKNATELNT